MKRLSRRIAAILSTMAMAVAFLVTGQPMVANAASVSATTVVPGTEFPSYISQFTITRTLSEAEPTFGDVVTLTTHVNRDTHGYLLYEVRDFTPACMVYVPGSATANKGGDFNEDGQRLRWSYGLGRIADPFIMTAQYTVLCDAGEVHTGGTWMKRAAAGNAELGDRNMGPVINVQQVQTSIDLSAMPTAVEVGESVALSASTTNIPNGGQLQLLVDGSPVGSPVAVSGGSVTFPDWVSTATGNYEFTAQYTGSTNVAGSTSNSVSVLVQDTTAPDAPSNIVVDPQPVDHGESVMVSGQAEAGSEVSVKVDGTEVCTATATAEGTFECSFPANEGQNGKSVTVTATDAAGNTSPAGSGGTLQVNDALDTTAPDAPSGIQVSPQPVDHGATVMVTGDAEAGSEVSVKVDGTEVCTATATDAAGNTSPTGSGGTLQVNDAPVPTDPSVTITPNPPVAGEETEIEVIGDEGDEVVVIIDDEEVCRETIGADGTATCTWTPGEPGETEIEIVVGENDPIVVTVDVQPADDTGTIPGGSLGGLLGGSLGGDNGSGSLGSLGSSGLSWFKGSTATGTGSGGSLGQSGSWGQVG